MGWPAAGRATDAAGAGVLPEQEDFEGSDRPRRCDAGTRDGAEDRRLSAGSLPVFPLTPFLIPMVARGCACWSMELMV